MDMSNHISAPTGEKQKQPGKRKKKGGWPSHKCLTRQKVKEVHHALYMVEPNVFLSINLLEADGETARRRKDRHRQEIAAIGKWLKNRKIPWLAVTVYQWPEGERLHCHHALRVPPEALLDFQKWIAKRGLWEAVTNGEKGGYERHGCPYDRKRHLSYMTRQRQFPCKPSEWKGTEIDWCRPTPKGNRFKGSWLHYPAETKAHVFGKKYLGKKPFTPIGQKRETIRPIGQKLAA
jgi:hypothetical protein